MTGTSGQDAGEIRVRFAPSPTGYLHIGGARTAIFNWLFARKHRGKFLLRIEDTDVARSSAEMVEAIFSGLQWLGLDWDEEPVFQSSRLTVYAECADRLVQDGKAYKCFCSQERLQQLRERAAREKLDYKYDRHCLTLTPDDVQEREARGEPYVVRFKVGEGATRFEDRVYGKIAVQNKQIDDFVILRSDGRPTYHLAVVVDDHDMGISHVIRGSDHLSNTPKHLMLFEAFGWAAPQFAHVPLIMGPDGQRLSKRHGATAIEAYRDAGYLPDAMLNFLALLGWSSGDDRELFSREELIQAFDLSGISKKSAVFDERKLEWMNGQYLNGMAADAFLELLVKELRAAGLVDDRFVAARREWLRTLAALVQPRLRKLSDLPAMTAYFFQDPTDYEERGAAKHWREPALPEWLSRLRERLAGLSSFGPEEIETAVRSLAAELGIGAGKLIHPTRLALTGLSSSPGLFEIMALLGKDTVLRRLDRALAVLSEGSFAASEA